MQKYKINYISERKKIQTKFGEKEKVSIKVDGNNEYLGVWINAQTANLKVGDEVEGTITETKDKNGKSWWNFDLPKRNDVALEKVIALEITVDMLKRRVEKLETGKADKQILNTFVAGTDIPYPTEPDPEDIPF